MNIACPSCPAKYAVPDDKVRGRKVKITCKRCGAAIIVDGSSLPADPGAPGASPERVRKQTMVGGLHAPAAQPPVAAKPAAPAAPPWTVAVTDEDHREMTTAQVIDAYAARTIDAETFVWRDGMPDWLTPFEIPEIEAALRTRGLPRRTNEPTEAEEPAAQPLSGGGAWREPGRWDGGKPASGITFDDVTVAMEAPKAQALLDAASSDGPAASPAPAPAAAKTPAPAPADFQEDEATVVADSSRFVPPSASAARAAPRPAAGQPPEAGPERLPFELAPDRGAERAEAQPAAAATPVPAPRAKMPSVTDAPRGRMPSAPDAPRARMPSTADGPRGKMPSAPDAPRARAPSIPPEPPGAAHLTGARNESSVLFSLDQLVGKAAPKPAPSAEKIDEAALMGGSTTSADDEPPSVANLAAGALFTAPVMAAPDFTAPAAASSPQNALPSASIAPVGAPSTAPRTGVWTVLAIAALVLGGGAAFLLLRGMPAGAGGAPTSPVAVTPGPAALPPQAPTTPTADVPAPAPSPVQPAAAGTVAPALATASAAAAPPPAAAPAAVPGAPAAPPNPTAQAPHAAAAPAGVPAAGAPKPATAAPAPASAAAPAESDGPPFDKDAALAALGTAASAAQAQCAAEDGPHGSGKVTVTFMNSGRATNALVAGDFAGSALGGCVARVFRGAKVPPFSGDSVRVTKSVTIP